ncbi:uncharacterized protein LOC134812056 [Bolinopsis microptera]|uniref:uncharacterized protein LOC134812056 n=1 Tax=Bolinopsis microptera TaxID=2820187 RepID=UPI003079563B
MDSEGKSSHSSKSDEKLKKKKKKGSNGEKLNHNTQSKKRPKKKQKTAKKSTTTPQVAQVRTTTQYVIPKQPTTCTSTERREEGDKCDIALRWDYLNSSTEADTAERLKWYKIHRRMRYQVASEERKAQQLGIMGLENMTLSKPPTKPIHPG